QVVQARCGQAQQPLLLNGGGVGVALDAAPALEVGAVLPGDLLPDRLTGVLTEADPAIVLRLGEEDPPPVLLDRYVIEVRPALAPDADRGAQVDVMGLQGRPHLGPPVHELRLPAL